MKVHTQNSRYSGTSYGEMYREVLWSCQPLHDRNYQHGQKGRGREIASTLLALPTWEAHGGNGSQCSPPSLRSQKPSGSNPPSYLPAWKNNSSHVNGSKQRRVFLPLGYPSPTTLPWSCGHPGRGTAHDTDAQRSRFTEQKIKANQNRCYFILKYFLNTSFFHQQLTGGMFCHRNCSVWPHDLSKYIFISALMHIRSVNLK